MSGANYAVFGFGAAAYPNWHLEIFRVWRVRVSYVIITAWFYEVFQYWRQTGWDKIQSAVWPNSTIYLRVVLLIRYQADGHLIGITSGLFGGFLFRRFSKSPLPLYVMK